VVRKSRRLNGPGASAKNTFRPPAFSNSAISKLNNASLKGVGGDQHGGTPCAGPPRFGALVERPFSDFVRIDRAH
jgi:hypothetical protein